MGKMIRKTTGGTWFKIKAFGSQKSYWLRPICPDATELLMRGKIIAKECYSHCLFGSQSTDSI